MRSAQLPLEAADEEDPVAVGAEVAGVLDGPVGAGRVTGGTGDPGVRVRVGVSGGRVVLGAGRSGLTTDDDGRDTGELDDGAADAVSGRAADDPVAAAEGTADADADGVPGVVPELVPLPCPLPAVEQDTAPKASSTARARTVLLRIALRSRIR